MTVFHLARAILETARISAPTVVDATIGRLTPEICDERLEAWSRRLLEQAEIELTVYGLENVRKDQTYVVMSNHQSLYDIPAIFQALHRRVRMVAKKELFRIPVWARAMRAAGFVEVDRQNRDRAIESLGAAEQALASGTDIWIAPEGTRSRTGELGPFKKGGFHLALSAGAPILPISVSGSREVLVARSWTVRPGAHVTVTISPAIDPKEYGRERRDELMAAVRTAIASHLTDRPEA